MVWIYAVDEAALPEGSVAPVYPSGVNVVLARADGRVYAVSGACAHMACPLSLGSMKGHTLTCACHDWRFRKAKQFFADRGIPIEYIDYDLADEATQARIARELDAAGADGFPFVKIGNQIVEGYRPDRYAELLGVTEGAR